ncbi:MAG: ribulose-phosphate 3-epimerase [Erysipelotrichaceae bacterium]
MKSKISPSIMCGDWLDFKSTIKDFEDYAVDAIHIDIMDGEFVPNFTLGPDFINKVHQKTNLPLDIHLMVVRPEIKANYFQLNKNDILSFHIEMSPNPISLINQIKEKGCKVGIVISPDSDITSLYPYLTMIDMVTIMTVYPGFAGQPLVPFTLDKIKDLREYCIQNDINLDIEVDGNVSFENARIMKEKGANVFVAGSSSLFDSHHSFKENIELFRKIID